MSTELAVVRDEPAAVAQRDIIDGWVAMASDVFKLAGHICDTEFVPDAYRGNAPAVAAAILAGRELGIGPMTSLRHVQVVKGSPSLSAEYKRARVLAAGHEFAILELNTQRCRVKGRRRGSSEPALEVKFDMADAKTAGLLNPSRSGKPGAWQTRPRRMLFARAASELCDLLFSDVVNGLATTDLLAEGTDEDAFAGYDEADGQEPPKPAARTARRKTAAAGDGPRSQRQAGHQAAQPQDADENGADASPGAAGAAPSRGAQPLPPLPGEEDEPPPAETASDEVAKREPPAPGTADPRLIGVIQQHFRRLDFTGDERQQRLTATSIIISRDIGSSNELTQAEARAVADTLARCKDRAALIALLAAAEKAGDGDD